MIAQILLSQRFPKSLGIFDYRVPSDLVSSIKPGQLVEMPFRNSPREGVVLRLADQSSIDKPLKELTRIIDPEPVVTTEQLQLAEWMAEYYGVSIGTITKTMLPPIPKRSHAVRTPKHQPATLSDDRGCVDTVHSILEAHTDAIIIPSSHNQSQLFYRELAATTDGMTLIIVPEVDQIASIAECVSSDQAEHIVRFHAKLNKNQAYAAWQKIQTDPQAIIIGTKLAVFLPLHHLQWLVIDHEENQNHHQSDQNPRFDVRTVVAQLSHLHHTPILYHSPAPSVATYAHEKNRHAFSRADHAVSTIDMREEHKKKNFAVLSDTLHDQVAKQLEQKKRTFLFLNKRGAAAAMICRDCGYIVPCSSCGQPAMYHTESQQLYCHRCNAKTDIPKFCPDCGGIDLKPSGIGTQSVETYLHKTFSHARVLRIDSDTDIPKEIDADIIVGTSRAFSLIPWETIGLVGVVSADTFLHLADYRAAERTWQILALLRYYSTAPLLIQTFSPDLPVFAHFPEGLDTFYSEEIQLRKHLGYPPAGNLIKLTFTHADKATMVKEAERLYIKLNATPLDTSIITPLHPKQHNKWSMYVLLRYSPDTPEKVIRHILQDVPDTWTIDRDPETIL